jgi:hypothetical protein
MDLRQMEDRNGAGEFKAGEVDEVEAGEDGEATLVVADETAEAALPGEGALKHPATMPLRR